MFGLLVAHRRPRCEACAAAFQRLVLLVQTLIYPQLYRYILHPCVSWPDNPDMCGGLHTATGDLRFDSFLTQDDVVIMLIYEVSALPSCIPIPVPSSHQHLQMPRLSRSLNKLSPLQMLDWCQSAAQGKPWVQAGKQNVLLAVQVFPKCGDGVNFVVTLSPVDGSDVQVLHEAEYEVAEKPTRQRLHFYLDRISTGDKVDLLVYPGGSTTATEP